MGLAEFAHWSVKKHSMYVRVASPAEMHSRFSVFVASSGLKMHCIEMHSIEFSPVQSWLDILP
jgi:hypothetical protein